MARRATVTSWPKLPLEMSWFWQNTQRKGHPEKKIAPDPASPEMGGSSQKCSAARATHTVAFAPHAPRRPSARRAPQARGHSRQASYAPVETVMASLPSRGRDRVHRPQK